MSETKDWAGLLRSFLDDKGHPGGIMSKEFSDYITMPKEPKSPLTFRKSGYTEDELSLFRSVPPSCASVDKYGEITRGDPTSISISALDASKVKLDDVALSMEKLKRAIDDDLALKFERAARRAEAVRKPKTPDEPNEVSAGEAPPAMNSELAGSW